MVINVSATLGELVIEDPRRARVLERFGLDYCCNGHRSLSDAVTEAGLGHDEVVGELDLPGERPETSQQPRQNAQIAHDIVDTHHAYMWEEMPRLQALVDKVHGVHGAAHPELAQVREAYSEAVSALDPHMTTEERVVFPAISKMEKNRAVTGSLVQRVAELREEHEHVGGLFKRIRTLTGDFGVPEDGCASYRAMLAGIEEMELDLHEHIHKENNVLFPRALELERTLSAG